MKAPSKLDQIRALREAANSAAKVVIRKAGVTPDPRIAKANLTKTQPEFTRTFAALPSDTVSTEATIPLLARKGDCPSCDRRRALLTAAKAKRRAANP